MSEPRKVGWNDAVDEDPGIKIKGSKIRVEIGDRVVAMDVKRPVVVAKVVVKLVVEINRLQEIVDDADIRNRRVLTAKAKECEVSPRTSRTETASGSGGAR